MSAENEKQAYENIEVDLSYAVEKEECEPLPEDPATYRRPADEDDDDYDPWSDRREEPPMFERDPWN